MVACFLKLPHSGIRQLCRRVLPVWFLSKAQMEELMAFQAQQTLPGAPQMSVPEKSLEIFLKSISIPGGLFLRMNE